MTLIDSIEPLLPAERRILKNLQSGELLDLSGNDEFGLASRPQPNENDKRIRAEFIRILVLESDKTFATDIHEKGVRFAGAIVGGVLDLESCTIKKDVSLMACVFEETPIFRSAKFGRLNLTASVFPGIAADCVETSGSLFLDHVFSYGITRLLGANIGSDLACIGSRFQSQQARNEDEELRMLSLPSFVADGISVSGTVFLNNSEFFGGFRLVNGSVGSCLECRGTRFNAILSAENYGIAALDLMGVQIGGRFFLDQGASIEGVADMSVSEIKYITDTVESWPSKGGLVLDGCVYEAFVDAPVDAKSRLDWLNLQSVKDWGADFWSQPYEQLAKVLKDIGHADEAGIVLMEKEKLRAEARRDVFRARLIGEKWAKKFRRDGPKAHSFELFSELERLKTERVKFNSVIAELKRSPWMVAWLTQYGYADFSLSDDGKMITTGAAPNQILSYRFLLFMSVIWDGLLRFGIGYGQRPMRAFGWLCVWLIAGTIVFTLASAHDALKPESPVTLRSTEWVLCAYDFDEKVILGDDVNTNGLARRGQSQRDCFASQPGSISYPKFNAFVYSADTLLPVVDLAVQNYWIPDEDKWMGKTTWVYLWMHIISGWALSLLAIAGFSGLVKSD